MQNVSLKDLLEAGCHFGHQVKRWHPKARPYIYGERDGIHIIDLASTRANLNRAMEFAKDLGAGGRKILFIATKRQAKAVVSGEAKRVGIPYLTKRWIGGYITNWEEVKKNLEKVRTMRQDRDTGAWEKFPKHEQVKLGKTLTKLESFYGGVAEEIDLPNAVFVVDIRKEDAAVCEASLRSIPIIGIVDTNSDPQRVDYPIPANDDAVGSITLVTVSIADAYAEGRSLYEKKAAEEMKAVKPTSASETAKDAPKETAQEEQAAKKIRKKKAEAVLVEERKEEKVEEVQTKKKVKK